jgi:hypothetical protein
MPNNREIRLLEVERMAAVGMTQRSIAAQVGVHPRTVADDMAILRHRWSRQKHGQVVSPPESVQPAVTPAQPTRPVAAPMQAFVKRIWTAPLSCEIAWASTPNEPGVYKWFLAGALPSPFSWPDHLTPISQGDLIYVGKASNLRTRAKHHKLQTSSSTLRRTLASLMSFPAVWHGTSAHPRIGEVHHALLTQWMTENLLMSYSPLRSGEVLGDVEGTLKEESKAPLNKDKMTTEQLYASEVGKKWARNAGPRRS